MEFSKLLESVTLSNIYTTSRRLNFLFNALYQERKRRNKRVSTKFIWAALVLVILPLFYRSQVCAIFIKPLALCLYPPTSIDLLDVTL